MGLNDVRFIAHQTVQPLIQLGVISNSTVNPKNLEITYNRADLIPVPDFYDIFLLHRRYPRADR